MHIATKYIRTGSLFQAIRLLAYGFVAGIAFLLSGCVKNNEDGCRAEGIEINPAITEGRITGNRFDPGDRIGLWAAVSPGDPGADNYAANVAYTFDGARWTAPGGSPLPWPGTAVLDLYAYWPYDPELTAGDPRAYPFSVQTDQGTPESYIRNDLLWAQAEEQPPGEPVPLLFSHLLSRVQVNIKASFDAGNNWPQNAEVAIIGLSREMTVDLAEGTVLPAGSSGRTATSESGSSRKVLTGTATLSDTPAPREENDIIPLRLAGAAPGYDVSFAAIVMPQDLDAGIPLIGITLDGKEYVFLPSDDFSFAPGETLTLNLTLTEEWPGLILDMAAIDWERSRVWDIYNGNKMIGRICWEYLFRNPTPRVDQVAEVVYPVDESGRAILASGFVVRVYNRTPNRQTNRYEYNTASVHGGAAVFGPKDTLYTYTSGNLPLINKVSFSDGQIEAAPDEETPTLTARPYIMTDPDGNDYPVVKVGTQYWNAENYRAEHYTDGTPLTYYYYNDDAAAYKNLYGALYTWDTAVAAGFAPEGWRLPAKEDWTSIWHYLYPEMGRKIKSLEVWPAPNTSSDNASGFSALPGGRRLNTGGYNEMGSYGQWWGSTQTSSTVGYRIYVGTGLSITESTLPKTYAESVRLMHDN